MEKPIKGHLACLSRPGQVPVVLLHTKPGDAIFHPLGPGSGTLQLEAVGWIARSRIHLPGQLLTFRCLGPSPSFSADSAFLLSLHVLHSSLPLLIGLSEKHGRVRGGGVVGWGEVSRTPVSCGLWRAACSRLIPAGLIWNVGNFSSLPSHCLFTLQKSLLLPTHCWRQAGSWRLEEKGSGMCTCACACRPVCTI